MENEELKINHPSHDANLHRPATDHLRRAMYGSRGARVSFVSKAGFVIKSLVVKYAKRHTIIPATIIVVLTIVFGTTYAVSHQILRQGADDPQIQMAYDTAAALGRGASAAAIIGSSRQTDLKESLATFTIIYDDQNRVLASSAAINGLPPSLPSGVFNYVKNHNEDRFTWAPQKDVRLAAVMVRVQGRATGFVLVGRSLKEIEKRETALGWEFFIAWILSNAAVFVSYELRRRLSA